MNLTFIKLDINILNDTKIKLIRKMPDGDSLLVLWIGILCLAMKSGTPGMIEIGDGIPFTEEALGVELDIPVNTVRLGLSVFEKYKMIELWDDGSTYIINFNKHQEIDKIKDTVDKSRLSSRKYREKLKLLSMGQPSTSSSRDGHVTVTSSSRDGHVTARDIVSDRHDQKSDGTDKDIDKDKDIKKPQPDVDANQPSAPAVVSFKNSGKHFRDRLDRVMVQVKGACDSIIALPQKENRAFNPYQAVQKAVNDGMHPDAILYVLGEMVDNWNSGLIENPWGWWRSVLTKNSRNLWEKENAEQAEGYKLAIASLAQQKDFLSAIGLTIKTIPSSRSSPC